MTEVFADGWTDFCVLLPVILVCCLFLAERREGLWSVIHAASGGRVKLASIRIGIMFIASRLGRVGAYLAVYTRFL